MKKVAIKKINQEAILSTPPRDLVTWSIYTTESTLVGSLQNIQAFRTIFLFYLFFT